MVKKTDYITSKAINKIWTLRRLSKPGFSDNFIIDVYIKEIRSILEYNGPLWNGGLTKKDIDKIEKIRKKCFQTSLKKLKIQFLHKSM